MIDLTLNAHKNVQYKNYFFNVHNRLKNLYFTNLNLSDYHI